MPVESWNMAYLLPPLTQEGMNLRIQIFLNVNQPKRNEKGELHECEAANPPEFKQIGSLFSVI